MAIWGDDAADDTGVNGVRAAGER